MENILLRQQHSICYCLLVDTRLFVDAISIMKNCHKEHWKWGNSLNYVVEELWCGH